MNSDYSQLMQNIKEEPDMFTDSTPMYCKNCNSELNESLRQENENLRNNTKNIKKLIFRTSSAIRAYEEMEKERDEFKHKYLQVKSQLILNQLTNPTNMTETCEALIEGKYDGKLAELEQIHDVYDAKCKCQVFEKLKYAINEIDFIKTQYANRLQENAENQKKVKNLEKKCEAQEKVISELRWVVHLQNEYREIDQAKIYQLEKIALDEN